MEDTINFDIEVKPKITGEIIIEDKSMNPSNLYAKGIYTENDNQTCDDGIWIFKYKDSVTFNCLNRETQNGTVFVETLKHEHGEDINSSEICVFNVKEDGYYTINHIVLPTYEDAKRFINVESPDVYDKNVPTALFKDGIYAVKGNSIIKMVKESTNESEESVSIKELIEANPNTTNVKKCKIDVVYTGHLQECYMDQCKRLFNLKAQQCEVNTYNRDFVWMTLNVIDYLVGFKQFYEAERLLSIFHKCGGFCKASYEKNTNGCGCS